MSGGNSSSSGATPPLQQLHQRILDFEAKYIRKLSLLDTTKKRERNTCMTSPLPRRPMPFAQGSLGRNTQLNFTSGEVKIRKSQDWPVQVNRLSVDSAENERKLQEIKKKSGVLKIGDQQYQATIADFEPLAPLGQGTSGTVVKMRFRPTGDIFAVKQMLRSGNKEEIKRVLMDLDVILRSHDCPYIIHSYGCIISDTEVWICMELMATCLGKLLKRLNSPIPEFILGKMTVCIVKALHYLKEKQKVMHRDVKPSNFLLDWNGTVKLCDFGISGVLDNSKAKSRNAGVAAYMAPERITGKEIYDVRADVWSLGISLVELSTGKCPYEGCLSDFHVLTRVLDEEPPQLTPEMGFSEMFCDFIRQCLTKDVTRRPKYLTQKTAEKLVVIGLLDHPFFKHYEKEWNSVDVAAWLKTVLNDS